jgi:transposase
MPERLSGRQVAPYRADPWRRAGEDLDHRGVVNQVGSKRTTNDSFVKRRVERLRRRCGYAYHGRRCCDCCDHEQQEGTASIGWVHAHSTL